MNSHSTLTRTVIKTLTYRAISILADFIVIYFLTKSLNLALIFAWVMIVVSTILYFTHERAWSLIKWGKVTSENAIELEQKYGGRNAHKRRISVETEL